MTSTRVIDCMRKSILLTTMLVVVTACESKGPAPNEGSLVVAPPSITWNVALGGCTGANPPALFNDHQILISTFTPQGRPLGNIDLDLTLELAGNTSGGAPTPVMFLFDSNSNGSLNPSALVSATGSPTLFKTKTDDFGNKIVWLRVDLGGCSYTASLVVSSGSLVQRVEVSVEAS